MLTWIQASHICQGVYLVFVRCSLVFIWGYDLLLTGGVKLVFVTGYEMRVLWFLSGDMTCC